MAISVHAPRINNNDDEIKVLGFEVGVGDTVRGGQVLGQVETDKAVLDVTAPGDGYVLGFVANAEEVVKVGSIMLWLGDKVDEPIPCTEDDAPASVGGDGSQVTAKAKLLMSRHGLRIEDVTPISGRITVEAVERHLAARSGPVAERATHDSKARTVETVPEVPGIAVALTREEKGMAATVVWHRDVAATGYIELDYDLAPWLDYAKRVQETRSLMLSPLLALMAWRLVEIAAGSPRLNATFVSGKRFEYSQVNLGFTIQAGEALYLAVVRNAAELGEMGFVNALGEIQRRATAHTLRDAEATGATIGFSSMERWKVTRHIPILPPHTALMIAHAAGRNDKGTLGATYDHRVMAGAQVVTALRLLTKPNTSRET